MKSFIIAVIIISIHQYLINSQINYAICDNPLYCTVLASCPEFSCKGSDLKTLRNASECGCCHKCIKELKKDEECQSEMSGNIPGTECGPHLKCFKDLDLGKSYCRSISQEGKGCESKRKLMLEKSEQTKGEPIPDCDEYGYYAPKLCKNGTLCHCQNKNGERIFGSSPYADSKDMDCLCSRQFDDLNVQLKELNFFMDPVYYLRCKANGNYEPFQFSGNITYCVNTTSGEMDENPIHRKYIEQLKCYKNRYDYTTECIKQYTAALENITKLEEDGYMVVDYDVPKCDIDGSFAPLQCQDNKCYCVNKQGEMYKNTDIDRVDREGQTLAQKQACNCVRELELIRDIGGKARDKVTDLFANYKCDKNGNYLPLQCDESTCYCVDPIRGYQESTNSALKTDCKAMSELSCLKNSLRVIKMELLGAYKDEGGCTFDEINSYHLKTV